MEKTINSFKTILWEYDIDKLKFDDEIVINRVLQYGEIKNYKLLLKKIGKEKIVNCFKKNINIFDNKSRNFYEIILGLESLKTNNPSVYEQINSPIFKRSFR